MIGTDAKFVGDRVANGSYGNKGYRVGVEVGGTFTDLVAISDHDTRLLKVPSDPNAPYKAVIAALEASGIDISQVQSFVHGSTVATNTILERKGAKTAFIATDGFRDILEIQRHDRSDIHAVDYQKPLPLVPRQHCFEAPERIGGAGEVVSPLDEAFVLNNLVPALRDGAFESVAVCLLNAHQNGEHERALKALLALELPDLLVTLSSEVIREFREYERASTTVMSAYVQPVINGYLSRLEAELEALGYAGQISIMQSNGGRIPVAGMRETCISAFLSGPASGVVGAIRQAERSDVCNILTLDMGGTSSDVALVKRGDAEIAEQAEVNGLPIRFPMIDISTIGAGGGSIVAVDEGGMLHVGPRSAGAQPGPACYGRGGTLPTLTDANVICGILQPETFLGGKMKLDVDAAERAFAPVAEALNVTIEEAADGALSLAAANVVRAIQAISTERGMDPRDFVLVPYGGAGPLNATETADELGLSQILIPPNPGILSAFGLLASDIKLIAVRTCFGRLSRRFMDELRGTVAAMEAELNKDFGVYGIDKEADLSLLFSMRYGGQAFDIQVAVEPAALSDMTPAILEEAFAREYERIFFRRGAGDLPVEVVAIRLIAQHRNPQPPRLNWAQSGALEERNVSVQRRGRRYDCAIIPVDRFKVDQPRPGPFLVVSDTTSFFVDQGWTLTLDDADNIHLEKVTQ